MQLIVCQLVLNKYVLKKNKKPRSVQRTERGSHYSTVRLINMLTFYCTRPYSWHWGCNRDKTRSLPSPGSCFSGQDKPDKQKPYEKYPQKQNRATWGEHWLRHALQVALRLKPEGSLCLLCPSAPLRLPIPAVAASQPLPAPHTVSAQLCGFAWIPASLCCSVFLATQWGDKIGPSSRGHRAPTVSSLSKRASHLGLAGFEDRQSKNAKGKNTGFSGA